MKLRFILLVFALAFTFSGKCQCISINLIKNPSLEDYTRCPTTTTLIDSALYWTQPIVTGSTSDYCNSCGIDSITNDPALLKLFQNAYFGEGYAGIRTYIHDGFIEGREYFQGTLSEQISPYKCYFCEFWVKLFSPPYPSLYPFVGIDAIGIFFSDTLIKTNDLSPIHLNSQINNKTGRIIIDTLNWVKISGTFIANGGESYFTVGSFKYENEINKYYFGVSTADWSYYLYDNFSLCPCEDTISPDTIKPIEPELEVYPNPANENLFILFDGYSQIQTIDLEIYNVLGELVMNKQIVSNPEPSSVPITSIASGCYILVLKNGSSILYKDKLIVIK